MKQLFDRKHLPQLIATGLLVVYIISGLRLPDSMASSVNTMLGKTLVVVAAIATLIMAHPVLGVVGLVAAYELISRSDNGSADLERYYPTEEKKWSPFSPMHQFPYTLEQEMVKRMAPPRYSDIGSTQVSFKPVLDDTHGASSLIP